MNVSEALEVTEIAATSNIYELCEIVKEIEDSGEYQRAIAQLGKWWQGVGVRPDIDRLSAGERAAILLRAGTLSGWLGSMRQIADAQEKAKDLISEGIGLFEQIEDRQNWAEARSDLAVCYWREGGFDEARDFLQDTLADDRVSDPVVKAKIFLRLANVEISSSNFSAASMFLKKAVPLVEKHGNDLSLGKLYFHRALITRRRAEEANNDELLSLVVEDYNRARHHYEKALHHRYAAMVENNLGFLYIYLKDFQQAHIHLDKALEMYSELKDKGRAALVYDNKARAFVAEGRMSDAELAALTSVNMLREGGENATLAESLTTLAMVLSRGGNTEEAIGTFEEAKETALMVGDKEGAGNAVLTFMEELQTELTPIIFRTLYLEADEFLHDSPKRSNVARLQQIARAYFASSDAETEKFYDWENFSLPDAVYAYESELILTALEGCGGRVTKAAKLLGVSHQSLSVILHKRHKDLQEHAIRRKPRALQKIAR
jgi:tetratricopeptide (TPR) repeat protein